MTNNTRNISAQTRILTASDVYRVLDMTSAIDAVEKGFLLSSDGIESKVLGFHASSGGFHVKSALMAEGGKGGAFVTKINANFPANPAVGLPTIQGVVALFEAGTGQIIALMDSASLTVIRTAAASAVAVRALSSPHSHTMTIVGCGAQAAAHLEAIKAVRPIQTVFVMDANADKADAFAARHRSDSFTITATSDLADCAPMSDIVVTCTSSRRAFLERAHLKPNAFVAAVGTDSETKSEITPNLMASAAIVVDKMDQCAAFGDLQHAIAAQVMTREDVRGELADVLNGTLSPRQSADEIVIFDSTGVAFQDVVCAVVAHERACDLNLGTTIRLAAS